MMLFFRTTSFTGFPPAVAFSLIIRWLLGLRCFFSFIVNLNFLQSVVSSYADDDPLAIGDPAGVNEIRKNFAEMHVNKLRDTSLHVGVE